MTVLLTLAQGWPVEEVEKKDANQSSPHDGQRCLLVVGGAGMVHNVIVM